MYVGIDIGSTKAAAVILDEQQNILTHSIFPTKVDMNLSATSALDMALDNIKAEMKDIKCIVTTGYGRKLINVPFDYIDIPEIMAIGFGARRMFPGVKTIIDIGGQDSKVLRLDSAGNVADFKMNDICAAGTGRFIENMARVLEVKLDEIAAISKTSSNRVMLSTVCAVFAESEVISRMSQGAKKEDIIAGIHHSIATRVAKLANAIGVVSPVLFTGGVAKNNAVCESLNEVLGEKVNIPNTPQIVAALGAAMKSYKINNEIRG